MPPLAHSWQGCQPVFIPVNKREPNKAQRRRRVMILPRSSCDGAIITAPVQQPYTIIRSELSTPRLIPNQLSDISVGGNRSIRCPASTAVGPAINFSETYSLLPTISVKKLLATVWCRVIRLEHSLVAPSRPSRSAQQSALLRKIFSRTSACGRSIWVAVP